MRSFFCVYILQMPLQDEQLSAVRAHKPERLPTALSRSEALEVIEFLRGANKFIAQMMYGSGLWVMETLRLRVKDLDFVNQHIVVRDGKGAQDRISMPPESVLAPLKTHLVNVEDIYPQDLRNGNGRVDLPYPFAGKYLRAERGESVVYL